MHTLALTLSILLSISLAVEMPSNSGHYELATDLFHTLDLPVSTCAQSALEDPYSQWLCASYDGDSYAAFITKWQRMLEENTAYSSILEISEWRYFAKDDGELDFYARAYQLVDGNQLVIAYDTSEVGREVLIGVSEAIGQIMIHATGNIDLDTMNLTVDPPDIANMLIGTLMNDFVESPQATFSSDDISATAQSDLQETVTAPIESTSSENDVSTSHSVNNAQIAEVTSTASNPPTTRKPYNYCSGFANQQAAQRFYSQNAFSPTNDPYNLDKNKNGVPCEGSDLE